MQVTMNKLEKIKAEIERLIICFRTEKAKEGATQIDKLSLGGRVAVLEELLGFINSLPEEPVSEDLEEASNNYAESEERRVGCGTEFFTPELAEAFKAGSQWKEEQFEKNRLAACGAQTKEEADTKRVAY